MSILKPLSLSLALIMAPLPVRGEDTTITEIHFAAGYCLGFCPSYEVTFKRNGCAVLNGGAFLSLHGRYTGTVSFERLARKVESLNYKKLADSYYPTMLDAPSYSIDIVQSSTDTKRIQFHDNDPIEPLPLNLLILTNVLEDYTYNVYWYNAERNEIRRITN